MVRTARRPRQHAAALVAARLGTSVREICRTHGVARSALYLAIDGAPWARTYVRARLGPELAESLIGAEGRP